MKYLSLILPLSILSIPAFAASVAVTPTRLVISTKERSGEASIVNTSDKPVRYKIQLVDHIMTPSGTIQQVSSSLYSAKEMLRYMPKVVSLEPGKRQTIRFLVTRPTGLPDGDYHTHVIFDEIIGEAPPPSSTIPSSKNPTFDIGMSYSMGIPLVVEQGKISSTADLISGTIVRDASGNATSVKVTMRRQGNAEGVVRLNGTIEDGTYAFTPRIVRIYRETDKVEITLPLLADAAAKNPKAITLHLSAYQARKGAPALKQLPIQ